MHRQVSHTDTNPNIEMNKQVFCLFGDVDLDLFMEKINSPGTKYIITLWSCP